MRIPLLRKPDGTIIEMSETDSKSIIVRAAFRNIDPKLMLLVESMESIPRLKVTSASFNDGSTKYWGSTYQGICVRFQCDPKQLYVLGRSIDRRYGGPQVEWAIKFVHVDVTEPYTGDTLPFTLSSDSMYDDMSLDANKIASNIDYNMDRIDVLARNYGVLLV